MRFAGLVAAARNVAPFVLAAIGISVLGLATAFFVDSPGFGYDFRAYDSAARRIAHGEPLYLPQTIEAFGNQQYEGLYLYPPPLAVLLVPVTVLSESVATIVWMVLRLGLLVAACFVLPVRPSTRLATLGIAGISFPVLFDLNIGNVSILVLALCAFAWRWMGSPVAVAAHVVLAVVRFPFLVFGLQWLVQRRFRTVAWTTAVGVAVVLVTIPIVGLASYGEYIGIVRGLPDICSGPHFLCFESSAIQAGRPEFLGGLATLISYASGIAAITFAGLRRDEPTAFVVAATATLLVAPFIHPHYLVLLLLPAALLADRGHWWGLGLPLLGWLPDVVLPFTGLLAILLVLVMPSQRAPEAQRVA